jgi:hypothetical protein
MDRTADGEGIVKPLITSSNNKLFMGILALAIILGILSGFLLNNKTISAPGQASSGALGSSVTVPAQDAGTFKDFAEGIVRARPQSSDQTADYSEGAYMLERTGATPVALTSSVVDLSKYVGKKVKVFGETQQALSQGWLMDVGKVEEE